MKCSGCGSSYVELDDTWTKKGSLTRASTTSIYEGFQSGNYCSSCVSNNSRAGDSWTSAGNVTPHNQLWKTIIIKDVPHLYPRCSKENYGKTGMVNERKPGEYVGIKQTWAPQPKYTSG